MTILHNLDYNQKVSLEEYINKEGFLQKLVLTKTYCKPDNRNHYFITLYLINPDGSFMNKAIYIFFIMKKRKRLTL